MAKQQEEVEEEQEEQMSEEDREFLEKIEGLMGGGSSNPNEIQTVHGFLHNVSTSDDTTKTGYLTEVELGTPRLPERTLKELALFCKDVANMEYMADYFNDKAEILTSTSLSKNAKLLDLAVLQRKETTDSFRQKINPKKSWFKKKSQEDVPQNESLY